ncbi:MAG: DUF4397 domain-containing protein [Halovenus sp.]
MTRRRRFLKTMGASAAFLALAGCASDDGDGDDDPAESNETDGGAADGNESMDDDSMDDNESEDDTTGEEPAMGNLRVAHLSPDAPNVDVYVDGDPVLEDVAFGTFSDYLALEAGSYDVQVTAAGDQETVVFDETIELTEGSFTAAAIGEVGEANQPFAVSILEDDRSDPGDQARVRAVHASPDAPNVDITVASSGDVLFGDVPFGAAGTATVPAGQYTLEIRPATENNDGDVVDTFDVEVEAGMVYTVAAVGYLEPGNAPAEEPFDLVVVNDTDTTGDDSEM